MENGPESCPSAALVRIMIMMIMIRIMETGPETCPSATLVRSSSLFPTMRSQISIIPENILKADIVNMEINSLLLAKFSAVCDNLEMEAMVPTNAYLTHSPTPDTFTVRYNKKHCQRHNEPKALSP